MTPRRKRLAFILGGVASHGIAPAHELNAFQSNLVFFFTPSQIAAGQAPKDRTFRIGGMVKAGSVQRKDLTVHFVVTDTVRETPVTYTGILPDLFREAKGVVAQGRLNADGLFVANEVLAKHDENYMPPEAQHAVDQARQAARTLQP